MPDLGDTLPFSSKLYDKPPADGGVLVNATTAALTITLPDGTAAPGITVTNPPTPTGTYQYDYVTTTVPGRFTGRWLLTMATGKTTAYVEEFDVRPADPGYVMSLASVKEHLNIPASRTTDDEELRGWLEAVTRLIESRAGEVCRKSFTERHNGGQGSLWLRHPPVLSVTTIVPWLSAGTTYAAADVRVTESGRVELLSGSCFSGGPFAVTYVAGRAVVPANLIQAAKVILKHLWETQRGASALPLQAADDTSLIPGFGFAIPNRAIELMAPDLLSGNYA